MFGVFTFKSCSSQYQQASLTVGGEEDLRRKEGFLTTNNTDNTDSIEPQKARKTRKIDAFEAQGAP